ncbi:MAG: hypothetical protein R2838_00985 [Caldilineaceae bacterium]
MISLDHLPDGQVEVGELLTVVVIMAANVVRDLRENIRNLTGGHAIFHEHLVQRAVVCAPPCAIWRKRRAPAATTAWSA